MPESNTEAPTYDSYFLSYSGVRLPLKLVGELEFAEVENRNTFFGACYNEQGQALIIRKVVYGEIEMEHRYSYHENGALKSAHITNIDNEEQLLQFDEQGSRL